MAALSVVSVLSGLILWWPLDGKWRRILTIKRRASKVRFNYDLHQVSGFYPVIVLLALLVSGLYFNLPAQFRWLAERFSPLTPESTASGNPGTNMPSINLEAALARSEYPGGVPQFYSFSPTDKGLFTACYRDIPELRPHVLDSRCLVLDRHSGELLQVRDRAHGSGGDVFVQWQWPLHSGKVFGLPGLACPVLYVTGIIRWLQKRRARQFKNPEQNRGFG